MTPVFILLGVLVLIVYLALRNKKRLIADLKTNGYDLKSQTIVGDFMGGHPDIDDSIKSAMMFFADDKLAICDKSIKIKGSILKDSIKDVILEDATTFGKRLSLGRIALVGVFALAWRKNSKNENSYLLIEWNDGRFDHTSSFLFEGGGSVQSSNAVRNKLIRWLK